MAALCARKAAKMAIEAKPPKITTFGPFKGQHIG
jgi:hypothetical protein